VDSDRARCVQRYRDALERGALPFTIDDVRRELTGHDLACWCPLDEPCHADVLLEALAISRDPAASSGSCG
jgi:hypothetical protein